MNAMTFILAPLRLIFPSPHFLLEHGSFFNVSVTKLAREDINPCHIASFEKLEVITFLCIESSSH